ncbi:MAG: RNA polymerase sigma factor [Anaerolineae bacterium]|nr:RNA polymerase sigma factor [Anaerolineae bacterium]
MLCAQHLPAVYNRLRVLLPTEQDAEDVTQDVFIAAIRGIERYHACAQFKTWLFAILRHKAADFYRSRGRQVETVPLGDDAEGLDGIEEQALVRLAIQRLPLHYQDVLFLRFGEGLMFHEIAGELGLSLEAVKSRYRRAMKAFKELLDA